MSCRFFSIRGRRRSIFAVLPWLHRGRMAVGIINVPASNEAIYSPKSLRVECLCVCACGVWFVGFARVRRHQGVMSNYQGSTASFCFAVNICHFLIKISIHRTPKQPHMSFRGVPNNSHLLIFIFRYIFWWIDRNLYMVLTCVPLTFRALCDRWPTLCRDHAVEVVTWA